MIGLAKKLMFTGVGLAVLTKEKAEEIAKECISKGQLGEKEGEAFVEELLSRSQKAQKDLQEQVNRQVSAVLSRLDLARKEDLVSLQEEIADLKEEVASLKQAYKKDDE